MKLGVQADGDSHNGTEQKDNHETGLSFYRTLRGSRRQCGTVPPGPGRSVSPVGATLPFPGLPDEDNGLYPALGFRNYARH